METYYPQRKSSLGNMDAYLLAGIVPEMDYQTIEHEFRLLEEQVAQQSEVRRQRKASLENTSGVMMAKQRTNPSPQHQERHQQQYQQYQQLNAHRRPSTPTITSPLLSELSRSGMGGRSVTANPAMPKNTKPTFQTTNMYAIDQFYADQQHKHLLQQQQQHFTRQASPSPMSPRSGASPHETQPQNRSREPSLDSVSTHYSIPGSPSRVAPSPLGSRNPKTLPDIPPASLHAKRSNPQLKIVIQPASQGYPAPTSSYNALVQFGGPITHGWIQRGDPIARRGEGGGGASQVSLTPQPLGFVTSPVSSSVSPKMSKFFSIFKKSTGSPMAFSSSENDSPFGKPVGKLTPSTMSVFQNRLYFFDQVKSPHAAGCAILSPRHSREWKDQSAQVVMEVKEAFVARDGVWVIQVVGRELVSGVECDLMLQAADCDEMVRWLRVLKSAIAADAKML
ncbi:hypothetical protein HDU98_011856 [Podochytrium sp. JEL0797]|nr:hypothetical protein HDU98_011856 [Podochytrium sp. JEL0797]